MPVPSYPKDGNRVVISRTSRVITGWIECSCRIIGKGCNNTHKSHAPLIPTGTVAHMGSFAHIHSCVCVSAAVSPVSYTGGSLFINCASVICFCHICCDAIKCVFLISLSVNKVKYARASIVENKRALSSARFLVYFCIMLEKKKQIKCFISRLYLCNISVKGMFVVLFVFIRLELRVLSVL